MTQALLEDYRYTVADFDRLGDAGHGYELVDGLLREKPVSILADYTSVKMASKVDRYLEERPIGVVLGSESGFRLGVPNTKREVRKPDVSVLLHEQLAGQPLPRGSFAGRPTLAFESVSPEDNSYELEEKLGEYLKAGVPLIWIIYAGPRVGRVMEPDRSLRFIPEDGGVFDGGDVLPGLKIKLADVLPPRSMTEPSPTSAGANE